MSANTTRVAFEALPTALSPFAATEVAYADALQRISDALRRGLPVLVRCDKGLTAYIYKCLRDRLKKLEAPLACVYLDGRQPDPAGPPPSSQQSMTQVMLGQVREVVRGAVDAQVAVLPHLDLLTTSTGGLSVEAREVIPLMYENPKLLWLGFADPSFPLPAVIRDLFPHHVDVAGVPRERLAQLVTQREARKLGADGLDVYRLYKAVSGVHAPRLRQILEALDGVDLPSDPSPAWTQLREATLDSGLSLPRLDLEADIGGYAAVKRRIQREILDIVQRASTLSDPEAVRRAEQLIPRGLIFWGPPGTGKTLFAKAMATALGAAVQVVSGPELKSRWVGESESRLRQIFVRARQSAPSLIVFDELDAFASARGTYTGSGVEHSMVNQLLTEMDGFRSNEMVFVVGTTNLVESLDPALLRPGRFEFMLQVPYPGADDRRAILSIYDAQLDLQLTPDALEHAVRVSAYPTDEGTRWSGDHLQALCRGLARRRLRCDLTGETTVEDLDATLADTRERPQLTAAEEHVVATHECGHAIVALSCEHVPPIERISIRGDVAGALGFVSYADPTQRHVTTHAQILDAICVLYGGREAEDELLGALSVGASHDLKQATRMARALVTEYGLGGRIAVRDYTDDDGLADATRQSVDDAVAAVLETQRHRARRVIEAQREPLQALRALLLTEKVLDARRFAEVGVAPRKARTPENTRAKVDG